MHYAPNRDKKISTRLEVLAESDFTKVVLFQGESDYILITFSPMRQVGENELFWGDTYSVKNRVTTVSFVAKQAHWYPNHDTQKLIRQIRSNIPSSMRRVLYGFSMGAYGALKYSDALDASFVLAFSPQFSIDPAQISDARFVANFRPYNRSMAITADDLCPRNLIVFDKQHKLDRLNALLIRKQRPSAVALLSVLHADHATINLVLGSQTLSRIIEHTKERPLQAKQSIAAILKARKKISPTYYTGLARRLRTSGRHDTARRVMALAAERSPNSAAALVMSAENLANTDLPAAIDMLKDIEGPRAWKTLARFYLKAGDKAHADQCLQMAASRSNKRGARSDL